MTQHVTTPSLGHVLDPEVCVQFKCNCVLVFRGGVKGLCKGSACCRITIHLSRFFVLRVPARTRLVKVTVSV